MLNLHTDFNSDLGNIILIEHPEFSSASAKITNALAEENYLILQSGRR